MKKAPFYAKLFECKSCDFKCSKKSDWNRHLFTAKHLNRINLEVINNNYFIINKTTFIKK